MFKKLPTPMSIVVLCAILSAVCLFVANWIEWMVYPAMVFGGICILITVSMIVYVWVIRPIKELTKKKK